MTSKQMFEYALIELNKVQAPSLLLEDYNYFINKAVNQYINKIYNLYDINQQKSDDIRVLKSSALLKPTVTDDFNSAALYNKTYEVYLPDDYLHILNCIVEYNVQRNYKCYNAGDMVQFGARRLTSDMFSQIINNYYMRPSYKHPYYYINNVNISNIFPTKDTQEDILSNNYILTLPTAYTEGDSITIIFHDGSTQTINSGAELTNTAALVAAINAIHPNLATVVNSTVSVKDSDISDISVKGNVYLHKEPSSTRIAENRYGNKSKVRLEIRYGKDNSLFKLENVYIDYLKAPQFIRLTQEQVDMVEDTSQILEFPDYVCQEIVNELIMLLMENASDPRLQTHIPISQSIANPAQEQEQKR